MIQNYEYTYLELTFSRFQQMSVIFLQKKTVSHAIVQISTNRFYFSLTQCHQFSSYYAQLALCSVAKCVHKNLVLSAEVRPKSICLKRHYAQAAQNLCTRSCTIQRED